MAENGTFNLKSGDKSLGIGGKDALFMLFVLVIGVMMFFRTRDLNENITALSNHIQKLSQGNDLLRTEIKEQHITMRQMLDTHDYNASKPDAERLPLNYPVERKK